jgi:hypothetical protein
MRFTTFLRFLGLTFAFLVIPAFAFAQQSITCEANNNNRKYCGSYRPDQVRLQRQISGSPCIEGETWGVDRGGLWVERGCRAIFDVGGDFRPRREYDGPGQEGGWWNPEPGDTWPPRGNWRGGRWDRGGVCFYKDRNFSGGFFCIRRGEFRDSLGSFGDDISSIRVFGGARVTIYDDRNFRGGRATIGGDVPDLRQFQINAKPGHTWNNRVSSVRVR